LLLHIKNSAEAKQRKGRAIKTKTSHAHLPPQALPSAGYKGVSQL